MYPYTFTVSCNLLETYGQFNVLPNIVTVSLNDLLIHYNSLSLTKSLFYAKTFINI